MIYDCFTFSGETDLLNIRQAELLPLNVIHVVVQSNKTFTGNIKPTYYNDSPNTVWITVKDMPDNCDAWTRETFQRNAIMRGLTEAKDDDIILISDVDEIISADSVRRFTPDMCMAGLCMNTYRYYLNCLEEKQNWIVPRILNFSYLKDKTPDSVRREGFPHIIDFGGWHYSYVGGEEAVRSKLESYSHQEWNTEDLKSKLKFKIDNCQSLFDEVYWTLVPIDESYPKEIYENQDKYKHLIKQNGTL